MKIVNFGLGNWTKIIIYICDTRNSINVMSNIARDLDMTYSALVNNIDTLESLYLIKTKKIGRTREIILVKEDCLIMARNLKQIKKVLNNAKRKRERKTNNKQSTNR